MVPGNPSGESSEPDDVEPVRPRVGGWGWAIFFLGWLGGLIGYFSLKSDDERRANHVMKWGFVWTAISIVIGVLPLVLVLGVFTAAHHSAGSGDPQGAIAGAVSEHDLETNTTAAVQSLMDLRDRAYCEHDPALLAEVFAPTSAKLADYEAEAAQGECLHTNVLAAVMQIRMGNNKTDFALLRATMIVDPTYPEGEHVSLKFVKVDGRLLMDDNGTAEGVTDPYCVGPGSIPTPAGCTPGQTFTP